MSSNSRLKSWFARNRVSLFVGIPVLIFVVAPGGLGMGYPITDTLRGHPHGPHGTQPPRFVGLWVRDETVMYDFLGQAFYLMPDGRFAGMKGMSSMRWHFDNDRLYIDAISLCGNCYQGNVTSEYVTEFIGPDELLIKNQNKNVMRGIGGKYRRLQVSRTLKAELGRLKKSKDENEAFRARIVLKSIDQF